MQPKGLPSFFLLLGLAAVPARSEVLKDPCQALTRADVEAATHVTLDQVKQVSYSPQQLAGYKALSECHFYDSRLPEPKYSEIHMKFRGALVTFTEYKSPIPDAVVRTAKVGHLLNEDGTLQAGKSEEGLGDAALWVPGVDCELTVFIGPSAVLHVRISGMSPPNEAGCRQAARTLARKAMGGTGKTGYAARWPGESNSPSNPVFSGKAACDLLTAADVGVIVGFAVRAGRRVPLADVDGIPDVSFSRLLATSGCIFDPAAPRDGQYLQRVEIALRYTVPEAACAVLQSVRKQALSPAYLEYYSHTINYPAVWLNGKWALVAFKEAPNSTMVLQLQIFGAMLINGGTPSEASKNDKIDRTIRLATRILGVPPKSLATCQPRPQPSTTTTGSPTGQPTQNCGYVQETYWVPAAPGTVEHGHSATRLVWRCRY